MRITLKVFIILFCIIYVIVTFISIYRLYSAKRNTISEVLGDVEMRRNISENSQQIVEIWGKAAIGLFLWKHILGGELEDTQNGFIQQGYLTINDITFVYRSGPGIIQTTVPNNVQHLVLVLNGRSDEKVMSAIQWLDYLPLYANLKKVAVVLLGNEKCDNNWILPYVHSHGGLVNVVFLVYDSPLIDNVQFYQWPLGVAVYRGFPNIRHNQVDVNSARSHVCNFLGTVYENSSREALVKIIKSIDYQDSCIIVGRKRWQPLETDDSLRYYMESMLKTDLTLCPVGRNTECYRIYEAMSLGSVPVIENVMTQGNCDASSSAPLRLLKEYEAPVIFINSWYQLYQLLKEEAELTLDEKIERRTGVIRWYSNFKRIMSQRFIHIIKQKFF